MEVTERGMGDRVTRRAWMRVTRGWKECMLKMADKAVRVGDDKKGLRRGEG